MKKPTLRALDVYGRARSFFVKRYLRSVIRRDDPAAIMSWQPLFLIVLKTLAFLAVSLLIYRLRFTLGGWLEKGFAFFKFSDIYNFQLPGRSFFDRIAGIILLSAIGYYGIAFLGHQLQALCSSLVVSAREAKIFFIRSYFFKKDLYVFPIPETDSVILKQNAVSRLLGIGTIVLKDKNGNGIEARGLKRAEEILAGILSPETPRDPSGFAFPGE